jgi:hypothetical protein
MSLDLDVDPRLADRIRRTLDAVAEHTPESGPPLVVRIDGPSARRPHWALPAAAAAAVALVVGLAALRPDGSTEVDTSPPADSQPGPGDSPTTTAVWPPEDVDRTSAEVLAWRELVVAALAEGGWPSSVGEAFRAGEGTLWSDFVALVGPSLTDQDVLVDFQTFAPGEYRSNLDWQREVAGSRDDGQVVPEGRLFLMESGEEVSMRGAIVVTEHGVLMVRVAVAIQPPGEDVAVLARRLAAATTAMMTDP